MHRCIQEPKTLDIHHSICLADGYVAETQWAKYTNNAQTSPVAGAEPREVMPLVSYRASAEAVLRWERSDRVLLGGAGNAVTEWSPGALGV